MNNKLIGAVAIFLWLCGPAALAVPPETRTSAFEYDPGTGLLTKEIIEPDNPQLCLVTTYTYDASGNKATATTSNCANASGDAVFDLRTSTATFASGGGAAGNWLAGQFPTTSANALGHSETKEFDPRFGAVTKLTGPNGLTTTWTYDGFGRKASETRADGTSTTWIYTRCVDAGGTCPAYGAYFVTETSTGAPQSRRFLDSLNREIRSESQGFDGTWVRKDTQYDTLGRVAQVSKPYYANAAAVWTTYQYDVLGRVVLADEPATTAGTTRTVTAYSGLTTTVTVSNAGGGTNMPAGVVQTRTTTRNSQGQVVSVTDAQGNTVVSTYDPFGNLTQTNAGGVITALGYDLRGRKISMADPDMGSWTYAYNALGELIRQTDAKSQVTTMQYDLLGRMTTRTEPDLVSTWTYDACTKGVGKLCSASSENGYARSHTYDALGRPSTLSVTIDTSYSVTTTYVASGADAGKVDTVSYPTGFKVKNLYNATGYLQKVQRADDPADSTVYWQANAQNAAGQSTSELLGNGLTQTRSYDALFRIQEIAAANAGGAVHSLAYSFDAIGNVTQRQDLTQGVTENFAYDALNRLVQAAGPGLITRSFDYNPIGNMIYKSDVGTYTYLAAGNTRPHAVSSVNGSGAANTVTASYTYDANGSLTGASGTLYPATGSVAFSRTLSYMSFNMPSGLTHVQGASSYSYTYTYNAEHERVKLVTVRPTDGTHTSIYIHPAGKGALLYEKEIHQTTSVTEHKHYVNGGSGLVGVFVTKSTYASGDGPEMRYYHKDHLGSVAAITNGTGAIIERLAYEAYGERRSPNGSPEDRASPLVGITTDRGFTAHEHLDEMMLIHMNGRIYDPILARFMTADPFIDGASNLQSFNRYSYVNNNPLMYTDPSGYFKLKSLFKIAAVAAVAYFTGVAISNAFLTAAADAAAASTTLSASTTFASAGVGLEVGSLTPLGGFVSGAGGGFAGGLVGSGSLEGGLKGAIGGGLSGGIDAYFGGPSSYPISRVFVQGIAGGISSDLEGGRFADGFKTSFTLSALTYGNLAMRDAMAAQARLEPLGRSNGDGLGVGFRGDYTKVAGGLFDFDKPDVPSNLGGYQASRDYLFFGIKLDTGTTIGRTLAVVMEAYAGPHDFFNSGFWYDGRGAIRRGMTEGERFFGEYAINYSTSLLLATPLAVGALVPEGSYSAINHLRSNRSSR